MSRRPSKNREIAILLAAFGFISKDVEATMRENSLTLHDILDTDKYVELRKIVRILQKLEIAVRNNERAERFLNLKISEINKKRTIADHIPALVGYGILSHYKQLYKQKRVFKALTNDEINDIYYIVERSLDDKKYSKGMLIENSFDLADELYYRLTGVEAGKYAPRR